MYEEIIYEVEDPVATITINRPERLNALTARTQVELKHAMIAAERDESVVGIILTGAGRAFSAGADMRSLAEIAERRGIEQDESLAQMESESRGRDVEQEFRVTWSFIPSLKKPVIAAVNGPCAGMSTAIATMCDLRFASESAVFTTSFSQRGLVPSTALAGCSRAWWGPRRRSTCCGALEEWTRVRRNAWGWSTGSSPATSFWRPRAATSRTWRLTRRRPRLW